MAATLLAAGVLSAATTNSTRAVARETNRLAGEGLRAVVVTGDTIRMLGWPTKGVVRVAEFPPGLGISLSNATSVVSRLVVQTQYVARIPRFEGGRDRLYSSFMSFLEQPHGELQPIGTNRFVEEMYGLAAVRNPLTNRVGKKGIMVGQVEESLAYQAQQGAIKLNLAEMVSLVARPDSFSITVDGRKLHFNRAFIESLDAKILALARAGVLVTLILENAPTGDPQRDRLLLHPNYDTNCPNHLSAFNTATAAGHLWFRGCLEFLADRYSEPVQAPGIVANFVIGQRVNGHFDWYNLGRAPLEVVVADYERTLRIAWTAVRTRSMTARVFSAIEHHWTVLPRGRDAQQAVPARAFLNSLIQETRRHGDLDWQVALHAWPESAGNLHPWQDAAATTNADTAVVTFKNLDRLPRFLYQRDQLYRSQPRRVMVCDQGFAPGEGEDGEKLRAAALAYAWFKSDQTLGVESFILNPASIPIGTTASQAAATRVGGRLFDEVYRSAGTPQWSNATAFALPLIGIKDWSELSPRAR